MDKQKKQLIILVVLLVALGIAAFIFLGPKFGGDTPKKKKDKTASAPTQPAATTTEKGQPAPGKGQPAQPGAKPVEVITDLDVPAKASPRQVMMKWAEEGGQKDQIGSVNFPYDPLFVANVDVVNPEMRLEIDKLRQEWILDGFSMTKQSVKVVTITTDEAGVSTVEETMEERPVIEAWFVGFRAPFKVDDRLTGTRYTIEQIIFGNEIWESDVQQLAGGGEVRTLMRKPYEGPDAARQKALVRLRGDKGNLLDLELAPANRYGDSKRK